MGTFRKDGAGHFHVLAKRREMESMKDQLADYFAFIDELKANPMPGTLKLRIKHLTVEPVDWEQGRGYSKF